jgi:carboxypeptidase family protein
MFRDVPMMTPRLSRALWFTLFGLCSGISTGAHPQETPAPQAAASPLQSHPLPGTVCGSVVDRSGALVAGAKIQLTEDGSSLGKETFSADDGRFCLVNIPSSPFRLTVTLPGFTPQTVSGTLRAGEDYSAPPVVLEIATATAEVRVAPSVTDIAHDEIKVEEKQRALGIIPNFYVSYVPNAAPLSSKQKFELAWKTATDPVTFGLNGVGAALEQATNTPSGYGQGAQGYAKRYGASYADLFASTFIGSAILPSLLRQDPRYFYKGTGSKTSRVFYALANSVICKGDNGHWQPNYSSIGGSLAAGGLSNAYYVGKDRGVNWTLENALISVGATAATNLLQEFVIKKVTPKLPKHEPVENFVSKVTGKPARESD